METWKAIPGYEGIYEASDQGRVRSLDREIDDWRGGKRRIKGVVLKPNVVRGYERVVLQRNKAKREAAVHRLVLETFVGPCPEGMEACHNDDEKRHNALSNLRWDTRSANHLDKVRNGRNPNSLKTHCPQGHEYTPENTYPNGRGRKCRKCVIRRNVLRKQAIRAATKEKVA